MKNLMLPYSEVIRKLDGDEWVYSNDTDFANPERFGWERMYTADQMREYAKRAVETEIDTIINLLMIQHEAAAGRHNYWHVAANLIKAERR